MRSVVRHITSTCHAFISMYCAGMQCVSVTSAVFTVLFLIPFGIEPFMTHYTPAVWQRSVTGSIQWNTFMSTVMWNYQGWDGLGAVAGEVKNGRVAYPLGVSVAVVMTALSYAIPVMGKSTLW